MLKRLTDYLRGKGDPPPPSPSTASRRQLTPWPAPLEQPPAPEQLLTRNWSHPFGDRSDPIQQLTHLAKASNGFYPMGVHGSWHGGVHFDGGTAGALDQSRVLCLADGEVVAYRIPGTTPTTRYVLFPEPAFDAPFASGFVLVRHRIQAPAIEGSDETPPGLTFYSLYMHLEDWAAYDGSTLDRPQFWLESDEKWVKDDANDLHKGQRGLKVTGHPSSSRTLDILAPGSQVAVSGTGTHRKLENTPGPASLRNADGTLRGYVAARFLPLRAGELFPVKADILNVRAEPDGQAAQLGELARDTMVRFSGNDDFVKLEYVEQYVRAADLRSEYVPARRDGVFVPETPIPIKAGELIGHIGEYQNARDSLPRRHLHLEVFCVDWFPGFLKDSRAWAARLPAKERTWLKLPKATAVFFHQEGLDPKSLPASGQPDLISDADLLVPKSLLDNLPAKKRIIHTSARQTRTWYRLEGLFHDAKGNLVDGWVEDPGEASWVSPWSWDGYEVIETSGSPVQGMAYRMVQEKTTSEEDRTRLRQQADAWNNGPLLTRLYEIIDRNHDRQMCADEVRTALNTPALAQALSKIVLRSESEWYYRDGKWDALDTVFGHTTSAPLVNWMAEKTRIRELSWWGEVMGPLGFPKGSHVYFLHPIGLIGHIRNDCHCGCCMGPKFASTRFKNQYGPVFWGSMKLADFPQLGRMVAENEITETEREIISAMSENEGNMDALQSYDSEILTAGAMQKTITPDGRGELPQQIKKLRENNPQLYKRLFEDCSWSLRIESGDAYLYYNGQTGEDLKKTLRQGFDKAAFEQKTLMTSKALAAFARAITDKEFLKIQVKDFVKRLHESNNIYPVGYAGYRIRDYVHSKLGKALVLDQHVNRPSFVKRDFGAALTSFFDANPTVSRNPFDWGDDHRSNEENILKIYGLNREMTHAQERYYKLRKKL